MFVVIDPFILIADFKPPEFIPSTISSKELVLKRSRDKSTETGSSKAILPAITAVSPPNKKVKIDPSSAIPTIKGGPGSSLAAYCYSVGARSSTFVHLLDDLLLPQTVDGHNTKSTELVMEDAIGHLFHVCKTMLLFYSVVDLTVSLSFYTL